MMRRFASLSVMAAWAALHAPSVRAETATLSALKDNTLYQNSTGQLSNGAGMHFFAGRTTTQLPAAERTRRGLIAFDVSSIPAGATITSVSLTLHVSRTNAGPMNMQLRRVLADWGEGTSAAGRGEGGGAPATTNDATWVHRFFNSTSWSTPGGDFSTTVSATTSVGGIGNYTWSGAGLVADVQAWVNGTSSNFGWILLGNEVSIGTAKRFDSSENSTVAFRPSLVVQFVPTAIEAHTWSAVKNLYR
jgi:hypothetical protein